MEADIALRFKDVPGFPRATRGWKGEPAFEAEVTHVSPALRGDGRASGATASTERGFPPRYAGMEEHVG